MTFTTREPTNPISRRCKSCAQIHHYAIPPDPPFQASNVRSPPLQTRGARLSQLLPHAQSDSFSKIRLQSRISSLLPTSFRRPHASNTSLTTTKPIPAGSGLLKLPLEIRWQICTHLQGTCPFLSRPYEHKNLYSLLFICRQLREEVSGLFYRVPHLRFLCPGLCAKFFAFTTSFLPNLTSLNISAPAARPEELEPVFEQLIESGVRIRCLVIRLLTPGGVMEQRGWGWSGYFEDDAVGSSMLPKVRWRGEADGEERAPIDQRLSMPSRLVSSNEYHEKLIEKVMMEEEAQAANVGRLSGVRSLCVFGHLRTTEGKSHSDGLQVKRFERGIIRLVLGIQETAREEGMGFVVGRSSTRTMSSREGWLEVSIEGEGRGAGY